MKVKFLLSTVLVLTLSLAACAPQAAPTKKAAVPAAVPPVTKPTSMPAATTTTASQSSSTTTTKPTTAPTKPSAASTPAAAQGTASTPTPGPAETNDIVVDNQAIQSDAVLISMVDALKSGWVAIFADNNGQPGQVLGYIAVPAGTSEDIKVPLNTKDVPGKMIAMLLSDAGQIGTFEYPGADEPVRNTYVNENVMAVFNRVSQ